MGFRGMIHTKTLLTGNRSLIYDGPARHRSEGHSVPMLSPTFASLVGFQFGKTPW